MKKSASQIVRDVPQSPRTINLPMNELPPALKAFEQYKQFIVYFLKPRANNLGKMDKIPFNYNNALEPSTWVSATDAIISTELFGDSYGVGFVFTEKDPFCFIDIDDCLEMVGDISTATPIALELMGMFPGAAIEISSSGKGLHLFFSYRETAPLHTNKNVIYKIELYTERRFVALTGVGASGDAAKDHTEALHKVIECYFLKTGSTAINAGSIDQQWEKEIANGLHPDWGGDKEDDRLIERMLNSKPSSEAAFGDKASFKDLWNRNVDSLVKAFPDHNHECGYDESSADAALACHLTFWTGKDAERTMQLMLQSGLRREKWDRPDYLHRTIISAFSRQKKVYVATSKIISPLSFQHTKIPELNALSSKFEIISAAKFASIKSLPWIIKGILPWAELAMVFGASGSGKSFLVLDLAFAITRGIDWCGHKVRPGKVVYIAAEGAGGLRKRLAAYEHHHKLDLNSIPLDIIPAAPNFLRQNDLSELTKNIGQATLIILDTLACIAPGGDENSSTDMGMVLANCKLLHQSTGALIMIVHHMGKDLTKGARGWSGLRAAVDVEIEVTTLDNGFQMRITKLKDGEDGKIYGFRRNLVDLGVDGDGDSIYSCVIEYMDSYTKPFKTPKGKWEKNLLQALKQLVRDDKTTVENVINCAIAMEPKPQEGKRDQRDLCAKRALNSLEKSGCFRIDNGFIFTSDNALAPTIFADSNNEYNHTAIGS